MYVSLRRKDAAGPLKRVLVLYPRPSSAYDIAITEMLHVFTAKELNSYPKTYGNRPIFPTALHQNGNLLPSCVKNRPTAP